jgi:hypothetical protein
MRRILALTLAAAALVATPLVPASSEDDPKCKGNVYPVGGFYVDDRGYNRGGVWVYMESNGRANLQQGGTSTIGEADPCYKEEKKPDTLIF